MNKNLLIKAGAACVGAILGSGWLWYLSWLGHAGLINLDPELIILDLVIVAASSLVVVIAVQGYITFALGGWIIGQLLLLIWDGMPHGRSPQILHHVNFSEALILALLVVAVFNWSMLPGILLGYLGRYLFGRNRDDQRRAK